MFPNLVPFVPTNLRLPHASGDVSGVKRGSRGIVRSSPCEWGCFSLSAFLDKRKNVFPMRVGMFPICRAFSAV